MSEYAVIYWAAACLVFWAGGGVTKGQFAEAVDMVVKEAKLTVPQEVLLKKVIQKMGGSDGCAS
jgi:hypothetical protein